jgi:hypothetical protein
VDTAARAKALGIDAPLGERFGCIFMRHLDRAYLHPTTAGYWQYQCEAENPSYGLAEVRASLSYGRPVRPSRIECARWRERLDYEAGISDRGPAAIPLPDAFGHAATTRVGEGWRLLVGLRDPDVWGDQPYVFARAFVRAWCQVTDRQARFAVRRLEDAGVMVRVGTRGRAILWQPGPPTLRLVLGSEDAVVDAFRDAFDATEEPVA